MYMYYFLALPAIKMVKKRRSKIVAEEDKENDDSPRMDRCAGTVSFLGDASQLVFIEDVSHLTTKLTGNICSYLGDAPHYGCFVSVFGKSLTLKPYENIAR